MWVRRVGAVVGAVRGGLRCRVGGEGGGAGSDGDGRLAATGRGQHQREDGRQYRAWVGEGAGSRACCSSPRVLGWWFHKCTRTRLGGEGGGAGSDGDGSGDRAGVASARRRASVSGVGGRWQQGMLQQPSCSRVVVAQVHAPAVPTGSSRRCVACGAPKGQAVE